MDRYNLEKKYEAFKLPKRSEQKEFSGKSSSAPQWQQLSLEFGQEEYYEIEYDSSPFPGVGKFVLKSQKIEPPIRDEVRERFNRMRDIARNYRENLYSSNKFYDKRVQWENARVLYKQGVFMQDFEDTYEGEAGYSSYFPNYQMMGYEQLRTYFTWRTRVRQGVVEQTSLSYAYLYIYELLMNIGVADPLEGLEQLMFFWQEYRELDAALDTHVPGWIKDYHIYYELPHSFREFVEGVGLQDFYPELAEEDRFELFYRVSKYDIRKSAFVTEEKEQLIRNCFDLVMARLSEITAENGVSLEDTIFQPMKHMAAWQPFKDSLFFPWNSQPDRTVMISQREIYVCSQNSWAFSSVITTERGKRLLGYIFKQMEAVLRRLTGYKHKLRADVDAVTHEVVQMLLNKEDSLERLVTDTVTEVYREATKTVVKVDARMLQRIREEAYLTQEKLTVPEEDVWSAAGVKNPGTGNAKENGGMGPGKQEHAEIRTVPEQQKLSATGTVTKPGAENIPEEKSVAVAAGPWEDLKQSLTEIERQALALIRSGSGGLKVFADEHGIMQEVLVDGINEKAMDTVGDAILDEEFVLYEDYMEEVRKLVEE